jgi:hypothetical protein
MSEKPLFVFATLLICSMTFAQHRPTQGKSYVPSISPAENAAAAAAQKSLSVSASPFATSNCSYTFTSPATAAIKYLQFCVTANGNVVEFQSPAGVEYIRNGAYNEGYGICDLSAGGLAYYDYADSGDSGNWLAPGPATLTATSVKIPRTTSDGVWTLTQTIALNKAAASVNVTMALKNNTAVARSAAIVRFADVDVGNSFSNNFDGTNDSAWGYNRISGGTIPYYGLLLQLNGPSAFSHEGFAINTPAGPDPCNSAANWVGTLTGADGGIVFWQFLNVPKNGTKTVKEKYTAF